MTLTEQVKIIGDKIKANKSQYELDREAAKISALSSGELEKYEYLTGEDLGYKPDVIQKAKFEYSLLGKVFNKGLDESDEKEGLLKRLKNTEGKNEQQLDGIADQGKNQLDAIEKQGKKNLKKIEKQEEQLKKIKNKKKLIKRVEREDKSGKIILLRDNLDSILLEYGEINIDSKGEDILKKLANDERMINCKNLIFKSGSPAIDNYYFFKRFGTLHDLFYDLISDKLSLKRAAIEQKK